MAEILYHDPQVTVHKEFIVINKYYFPLATSKTIHFSEIQRITLQSSEGVTHMWGLSRKYLNNWFPLDNNRKQKTKFIEIVLRGKKTRPSITPDDPDRVFRLIWENYTPEGRDYVEKMSEKAGKQTQIAQQQLMDRQKQMAEEDAEETGAKIKLDQVK